MRITANEKKIILNCAEQIFGKNVKVYLFGSRVYDDKKGGDIDLYIETDKNIRVKDKIKFLSLLQIKGIERKVDLVLKTNNSKFKSIHITAKKQGILL